MDDEDTVLEEAMDNLKEAGQRIRATQSLMRAQGMTDGENYRDLIARLSAALAMTEAAYLEARRRRELSLDGGSALDLEAKQDPRHDSALLGARAVWRPGCPLVVHDRIVLG